MIFIKCTYTSVCNVTQPLSRMSNVFSGSGIAIVFVTVKNLSYGHDDIVDGQRSLLFFVIKDYKIISTDSCMLCSHLEMKNHVDRGVAPLDSLDKV